MKNLKSFLTYDLVTGTLLCGFVNEGVPILAVEFTKPLSTLIPLLFGKSNCRLTSRLRLVSLPRADEAAFLKLLPACAL